MHILVMGGTRFFGVHMVNAFLEQGHRVTICTRGMATDTFGNKVQRLTANRENLPSLQKALSGKYFDVVCDNIAYSSNSVKYLLDTVQTGRYIQTSTMSVYTDFHIGMSEDGFDPVRYPLTWCSREDFTYDEVKRQAECALYQSYPALSSVAVRFPYVIGVDDYTQRLLFYVEHVIKQKPMHIDNPDSAIAFVRSDEAGKFLVWLAGQSFTGPINGASRGSITIKDILHYVELKSSKKAILSNSGEPAPYNGTPSYTIDTAKAESVGFQFSTLSSWIHELLDELIAQV